MTHYKANYMQLFPPASDSHNAWAINFSSSFGKKLRKRLRRLLLLLSFYRETPAVSIMTTSISDGLVHQGFMFGRTVGVTYRVTLDQQTSGSLKW